MAFCFKRKETAAKAVRRLCDERIDTALKMLRQKNHLDVAHQVRKEIKKLRSILRLTREEIGETLYRRGNDALRQAADCLTNARDAHVKLGALNQLVSQAVGKRPRPAFPKLKELLHRNCATELGLLEDGKKFKEIESIMCQMRKQIEKVDVDGKLWPVIAPGLSRSYRRGRQALAAVRDEGSPEHFHAWRKRVKDLFHQSRLLRPMKPRRMKSDGARLEKLATLLGDDHDLFLLQDIAAKAAILDETQLLNRLVAPRQRKLRQAAVKLGTEIYAEKPSRFTQRMGKYWKAWRGK